MSANTKSILAETLETIQTAKQQVEENANFILSTTLKDELSEIIKEGLGSEDTDDVTADEPAVDSTPTDDAPAADNTTDLPLDGADASSDGEEEVIDLTGATPEEVISSFKLMAPADEIEIIRSENGIQINFNDEGSKDETPGADATADATDVPAEIEDEPIAEGSGNNEPKEDEADLNENDGEPVFEIEITEDEEADAPVEEATSHHMGMKRRNIAHNQNDPNRVDETEEAVTETKEEKAEDLKESRENLVAARKKNTALVLENKRLQKQIATFNSTTETFKSSEKQYKEAIAVLKDKLQEVAVYTSNLTYAVKLMTENATTKDEKITILKRLDSAKSIVESREAYKSLNESFQSSKTAKVEQIIETKILNDNKNSSASKINETTVYADPKIERIKEIIGKLDNKK